MDKTPEALRQSSMSHQLNSGTLAPHWDDPSEEMTSGVKPDARQAARPAMMRPGQEDEAPTATAPPGLAPAWSKSRTTSPAQAGLVAVLLASGLPGDGGT